MSTEYDVEEDHWSGAEDGGSDNEKENKKEVRQDRDPLEGLPPHVKELLRDARGPKGVYTRLDEYLLDGPVETHRDKTFVACHFNTVAYDNVKNPENVLPVEFIVQPFSYTRGVAKHLGITACVDPIVCPFGAKNEIQHMVRELGLPMIGSAQDQRKKYPNGPCAFFEPEEAWEVIWNRLVKYAPMFDGKPLIFVPTENIATADLSLKFLKKCYTGGLSDDHCIRITPLSVYALLYKDYIEQHNFTIPGGYHDEGGAERLINHMQFVLCKSICCPWHQLDEHNRAAKDCSSNIVLRMLFNIFGYFRRLENVPAHPPFFSPKLM